RIIRIIVDAQLRLAQAMGVEKPEFEPPVRDPGVDRAVQAYLGTRLRDAMLEEDKTKRNEALSALKDETVEFFGNEFEANRLQEIKELESAGALEVAQAVHNCDREAAEVRKAVAGAYEDFLKQTMRSLILEQGYRPDGRRP